MTFENNKKQKRFEAFVLKSLNKNISTLNERDIMTNIMIVKLDSTLEVRRFTKVNHFRQFMMKNSLHTTYNDDVEDMRILYNAKNEALYKTYIFDNDVHVDDKSYSRNTKCLSKHFDDVKDVIIKALKSSLK